MIRRMGSGCQGAGYKRRMKRIAVVLLVAALGCKGQAKDEKPKAGAKEAAVAKDAAVEKAKAAKDAGGKEASGFCAEPCRALVEAAYDEVAARADKECGKALAADADGCEGYDYLRNCIYAARGYRFRKPKWAAMFGGKSWYSVDPGFEADAMPKVAMANVKALKDKAAECRASAGTKLAGKRVAKLEVDLDGDGKAEVVEVTDEGVGVAGAVLAHGLDAYDVRVLHAKAVDIDRRDSRREVLVSRQEYEDLHEYVVVSMAGGKPRLSERIYTGQLGLEGDGRLTTTDVNCGQTTAAVYTLKNGVVVKASSKKTGKYDPMMCAACPFVYVDTGSGWTLRGEILRDVRFEAAETTRAMRLGRATMTRVRVTIAERKPEVTFLDEVVLIAGGKRVAPLGCDEVCAVDGRRQRLRRGDELELEFEVPLGAELVLSATGYYVPL